MILDKNPFGVTSNIKFIKQLGTCDCCRLRFMYETFEVAAQQRSRCDECADHEPGGPLEDQLRALRDHEPRFRKWIMQVQGKANAMEAEVRQMQAEVGTSRQKVAAALQSRDGWQEVAAAALDVHTLTNDRGKCSCGNKHPCATLRAAEQVDRGKYGFIVGGRDSRFLADYQTRQQRPRAIDDFDDFDDF